MSGYEPFTQQHQEFVSIAEWEGLFPNIIAGFSTRDGGYSTAPFSSLNLGLHVNDDQPTVVANRRILAKKLDFPIENWVGSEQVHESMVVKVSEEDRGRGVFDLTSAIKRADGIYTNRPNVLLTSLYADCVPLYFFSPSHFYIGLAHAGWRGTVANIGGEMIRLWIEREQISLDTIKVAIGPCISKKAYEVDEGVIAEIDRIWPSRLGYVPYIKHKNQKYLLDLRTVNKQLLLEAGVKEKNIIVSSICTANDSRMFSHRAESGKTGRMMSFIGLRHKGG
ncbi:peptidoglycan editing factor PgeF [Bacillus solitudinis]|uniref:peptidoglycan editing factor PgeF n=1 Tax=Bacillus solitudinis TaxID=2014074 RepID=UPI001D0D0941|nr:peptidoglycan editing factor PgeF [Bacillus solitudinis]